MESVVFVPFKEGTLVETSTVVTTVTFLKPCSQASLVLPSICVHNNTRERKTGEKWGRPESIHHMSGCEVDVGREGPIFNYIRTKLESEFLTGLDG